MKLENILHIVNSASGSLAAMQFIYNGAGL